MAEAAWRVLVDAAHQTVPELASPPKSVCLEVLPDAVLQLRLSRGVPDCVKQAATSGQFCSVVQEPDMAGAWVPRTLLQRASKLDGVEEVEPGVAWCALCISSRGSKGEAPLPASLSGAAGAICASLAKVQVSARLSVLGGQPVLLVREDQMRAAADHLIQKGNAVLPATRVCEPVPWKAVKAAPSNPALSRRLAGVWKLLRRAQPPGTITEQHTEEDDGPVRLQASGGLFIEVRMARAEGAEASAGGSFRAAEKDGKILCKQLPAISFQPPGSQLAESQITFRRTSIEALAHPAKESREVWKCLSAGQEDIVALELQSEAPEPKRSRCGLWIFAGNRFARLVGPPRGSGLVAGTCCRSLSQLMKLKGSSEVRSELKNQYQVVLGTVEEPGLLRVDYEASRPDRAGTVFYSARDESTGEIAAGGGSVVYTASGGHRETWRIVEWTFDPFAPDGAGEEEVEAVSASEAEASPSRSESVEVVDRRRSGAPGSSRKRGRSPSPPSRQQSPEAKQSRKVELKAKPRLAPRREEPAEPRGESPREGRQPGARRGLLAAALRGVGREEPGPRSRQAEGRSPARSGRRRR